MLTIPNQKLYVNAALMQTFLTFRPGADRGVVKATTHVLTRPKTLKMTRV